MEHEPEIATTIVQNQLRHAAEWVTMQHARIAQLEAQLAEGRQCEPSAPPAQPESGERPNVQQRPTSSAREPNGLAVEHANELAAIRQQLEAAEKEVRAARFTMPLADMLCEIAGQKPTAGMPATSILIAVEEIRKQIAALRSRASLEPLPDGAIVFVRDGEHYEFKRGDQYLLEDWDDMPELVVGIESDFRFGDARTRLKRVDPARFGVPAGEGKWKELALRAYSDLDAWLTAFAEDEDSYSETRVIMAAIEAERKAEGENDERT